MAGFIHDPLHFINLISDNIRDRYKTPFSVIKEIIQNADDAGASHDQNINLDFGISPGVNDAVHPLLRGPGLVFLNNGKFTEHDARAVQSFGLNQKAIVETTIGKFGLGMKSVFHFCEAFFFMAQTRERSYSSILNPWSGDAKFHALHDDWDEFTDQDSQRIKEHLVDLISPYHKKDSTWFLLWLPLRKKSHLIVNGREVGSIIAEFPGDDAGKLDSLCNESSFREMGRFIPLLQKITKVQHWKYDTIKDKFVPDISMLLEFPDNRRRFPEKPEPSFYGRITCVNKNNPGINFHIEYTGTEKQLQSENLDNLKKSELWPVSYVRDDNGESLHAPDKTKAHCAVVFSKSEAQGTGQLEIKWAVFMPIDTGQQIIPCDGNISYSLMLHGYFFVDAGRAEVTGLFATNGTGYLSRPKTEAELRNLWNECLAQQGTLCLVIRALDEFVIRTGMEPEEVGNLCAALKKSDIFTSFSATICQQDHYVLEVTKKGPKWSISSSDKPLLPLPAPPVSDPSRPWKTFPCLCELSDQPRFVEDKAPHLVNQSNRPMWTEGHLLQILHIDVSHVFSDGTTLGYFSLFLQTMQPQTLLQSTSVQKRLVEILQEALRTSGIQLSRNRSRFQEIVTCVFPSYRFSVTRQWSDALIGLLQCDSEVLVIPRDLDAPDNPGKANLGLRDALCLLSKIDKLVIDFESKGKKDELEECRQLSEQILKNLAPKLRQEALNEIPLARIIDCHDCSRNSRLLLSMEEIKSCKDRGLLFLFSQGTNDQQRIGLGSKLQKVLHSSVLIITNDVANLVFGSSHGLPACDSPGCLMALGKSALELTGLEHRSVLIQSLAGSSLDDPILNRGMRYLLHGRADHFNNNQPLWTGAYQQSTAWIKLWRQLPDNSKDAWNILDRSLIEHIPQTKWHGLNIREINPHEILRRFAEVGFSYLDTSIFTLKEKDIVLIEVENDKYLWQSIPFHETMKGNFSAVPKDNAYLETQLLLPEELLDSVTVFKLRDDDRVRQSQNKFIPPLDHENLVQIFLRTQHPHDYYLKILDSLQSLEGGLGSHSPIRNTLAETRWMIDNQGNTVRPADVLYLDKVEDEVCRLAADIQRVFIAPDMLKESIQEHPYFNELKKQVFAKGDDGFKKLGLLLGESQKHAIGDIKYADQQHISSLIEVFKEVPPEIDLPGWDILDNLQSAYGIEKCEQYILPEIRQPIPINKIMAILSWLMNRSGSQSRKKVKDAYAVYLDIFARSLGSQAHLENIYLLNKLDQWKSASELCVDAEGVAPEDLLSDRHKVILQTIITSAGNLPESIIQNTDMFESDVLAAVERTAQDLKTFFTPWEDAIAPELIRAFLSLLGDDNKLKNLATSYQGSHSVDWIRSNLPWTKNLHIDQDGRKGWFYDLDQHDAIKSVRFIVEVVKGDIIQVRSMTGGEILVRLDQDFDSLIVGGLWYEKAPEGMSDYYFPKIRLRKIDVGTCSQEKLSTFLRKSAEFLLQKFYRQGAYGLEPIWSQLDKAEQLDIRIAQQLVARHIPYYLRQLGKHQNDKLTAPLKKWDDARYRVAEFIEDNTKRLQYEKSELKALEELQRLLIEDFEVQHIILEAVRSKIGDYQYSPASVMFELFQNADDAVAELLHIRIYPNKAGFDVESDLPPEARQFILQKRPEHLCVMYWGRPINYIGGSGFPGREKGYHQDLEKMLILSSSDKPGGGEVTGKFGLGFKSVFLVCDKPRLVSGRLHVEILGGMYPQKLDPDVNLKDILCAETASNGLSGTLIQLSLDRSNPNEVCFSFEKLGAILPVFSKQIRRLVIDDEGNREHLEWAASIVLKSEDVRIEYGLINLMKTSLEDRMAAIHIRVAGGGGLLFGLRSNGVCKLPDDIPAIWVMAPTQEGTGIGYAINGNFQVDAGRTRLSSNVRSNIEESKRLGEHFGNSLLMLFDQFVGNWEGFKQRLRLGKDLQPYDFWNTLWWVITNSLNKHQDNKVAEIISHVVTERRGLGLLAMSRKAIPNGLWGKEFQALTSSTDIRYVLKGSLSQELVFNKCALWDVFKQKVAPTEVISEQIYKALVKVCPDFGRTTDQWQSLSLRTVLNWFQETEYHVTHEAAHIWGSLFTSDFINELKTTDWGRNEFIEINDLLRQMKFRSKSGEWVSSRGLLIQQRSKEINADEPLRSAFAPEDRILSNDYSANAIDFVVACRGRLDAPVEEMVEWVAGSKDISRQKAAMRYLLEGELGDILSQKLREHGIVGTWLEQLRQENPIFEDWSTNDIDEVLLRKLSTLDRLRNLDKVSATNISRPVIDPSQALHKIHDWWKDNGQEQLKKYETETYDDHEMNFNESEEGEIDRSSWMNLFLLGAFHTFGRTQRVQHKGFIQLCKQRGWWDVFIKKSHKNKADEWMRVLDEYIDTQIDKSEYELWMNHFPAIYRISRYLEDYAEAFCSIDRMRVLPILDKVTISRSNPDNQGGGISAPPIKKTFGLGACFVVRELKRKGILTAPVSIPHCFVPVERVRRLIANLGCSKLQDGQPDTAHSIDIHEFLCMHLGEKEAEFQGSYDIPLQIVAERPDLQVELFGVDFTSYGDVIQW